VVQVPKRWRTMRDVVERLGEEREREYGGRKDGYEEWLEEQKVFDTLKVWLSDAPSVLHD
jgi:hypothetical protein